MAVEKVKLKVVIKKPKERRMRIGIRLGRNKCCSLFLLFALFCSCKPPLPVYFDKPIGIKVQGFDTLIAGNYILLEDVIEKGTRQFLEKYEIKYDKIVERDTGASESTKETYYYEEIKNLLGISDSSSENQNRNCDSIFRTVCSFNELAYFKTFAAVDKPVKKVKVGMFKISYDRIFFISLDSLGNHSKDTLLRLADSVLLTKYAGKYFINFKTRYGWEILQMEVWENNFLSIRPFYFTSYDDCASTAARFASSAKHIYPNLKPILNAEKKIIGFSAQLNSQLVLEKFKKTESPLLLMRIR